MTSYVFCSISSINFIFKIHENRSTKIKSNKLHVHGFNIYNVGWVLFIKHSYFVLKVYEFKPVLLVGNNCNQLQCFDVISTD